MTDSGAGEPLRMCAKRLAEYLDHRVGCDATWKNGVRRKFPDQGECGCGLNDLLNQPLSSPETTPAGVLDEAWAAAEKALPEGWRGPTVGPVYANHHATVIRNFMASAWNYAKPHEGVEVVQATPAAALLALAAALGRSGSGGGRG